MGQRGRRPLPIDEKIIKGTLRPSNERWRIEREQQREANIQFSFVVARYFLGEKPKKEDPKWILEALRKNEGGVSRRIWQKYGEDFRQEFARRYPGKPTPPLWAKYEGAQ